MTSNRRITTEELVERVQLGIQRAWDDREALNSLTELAERLEAAERIAIGERADFEKAVEDFYKADARAEAAESLNAELVEALGQARDYIRQYEGLPQATYLIPVVDTALAKAKERSGVH